MTLAEAIDLYEDLDLANAATMAARGQIHCDYCCETPHLFLLTGGEAKALCDYHDDLYKSDWWKLITLVKESIDAHPR